MKKRVDSLSRVQRVQKMLSELAEWRLTQMQAELAALENNRRDIFAASADTQMFFGPSAVFMTAQLKGLEQRIADAGRSASAQAEVTRRQKTSVNLAERLLKDANLQYRSQLEQKGLSDIIEGAVARSASSLTQDS